MRAAPKHPFAFCAALVGVLAAVPAAHAEGRYGKPGEPVHLTIGYQPYYTEAWSGVLVRARRLYAKHLPRGSTVRFKVGTKGAVVLVSALRRGEHQIGYLGLAPTLTAIQDADASDLRAVAVAGVSDDLCNLVLARPDAPSFTHPRDALAWLEGRRLAVPAGSCADLFVTRALHDEQVRPAQVIDQGIDVIPTSLRAAKLDAVAVWEPSATQLIQAGLAKRLVSGRELGRPSAAFIVMRADLIEARPDVVRAWLAAEREAQALLANPAERSTIARLIAAQTPDLTERAIREALYDPHAGATRARYPFVFTPAVLGMLGDSVGYMARAGRVGAGELRAGAIERRWSDDLARHAR